ncbi:glycosyltransferase family 39 protein, partial [bacterium]|nr:glycosyltransferase family 39 protein [bacterium]
MKRISLHTVSFLENNIFALGLGLGFWGYCIFFLGILGGLYSELVLGLFIVSSVFCFKEIRQIISEIKSVIICKKFSFSPWTAILIFAFILSFFASLGPVISTDALRYHLSLPNLYFLNHKIFILPNNFFSNFPALFDMLYLFTFFLKSSGLARMFHCLAGVLTALSIYSLGKKYFNFRTGILAALIFFTTPFVLLLSSVAFIDLGVAFFFFLSFYALFIYDEKKKINYLVVSAVFAGLSVSTKYSGGLFVLIAGILYFFKRYTIDKVKFSFAFRELIIFFGITLIVVSPWLLRNLFCVKNPVYPFFSGNNDLYMKILSSAGININKLNWFWLPLVVPWHITLYVSHFENWRAGMVYLAFLPFLFFLKGVDRKIKYLIIYCVLVYLIWVYGIQNVRFLLPVFPLLGIIIAYLIFKIINIVENSRSSCRVLIFFSKQFNFFIKGILSFIFVWNILHFLVRSPYLLPQLYLFWGRISRVDYLRVEIPFYEMFQYINRNLSPSAKILFLGHYHDGGYLKRNYLYSSEFEKPLLFSLI